MSLRAMFWPGRPEAARRFRPSTILGWLQRPERAAVREKCVSARNLKRRRFEHAERDRGIGARRCPAPTRRHSAATWSYPAASATLIVAMLRERASARRSVIGPSNCPHSWPGSTSAR